MSTNESQQPGQDSPAVPAPAGATEPASREDLRRVSDAQTMRALSHPVRIAIMETLSMGGAMTATQLGERIGESATTCSFHLRQLQKYQFVEEAGGGHGRARPWRMAQLGYSFSTHDDDPDTELASSTLSRMLHDRQRSRYQTWVETQSTFPQAWREASDEMEMILYCTAEELEALNAELSALLIPRFQGRLANPDQRPPGAVAVELMLQTYPIEHPPPDPEQTG